MPACTGWSACAVRSPLAAAVMGADGAAIRDAAGLHPMPALRAQAAAWAQALAASGLQPAEPVIVPVSGRGLDVAAMMAVLAAGGVAVPLHRRAHPDTAAHVRAATGARLAVDGEAAGVAVFGDRAPAPRPALQGAAFVTFTSGSTGAPKGVILSGDRMLAKLRTLAQVLGFPAGGATLMPLQLTFSFGQWVTFLTLMRGGTVHLSEGFEPATLLQRLAGSGIGHLAAVPTMLRMIPPGPAPGPAVRILTGGEAVQPHLRRALLDWWPAAEIFSIYGLTESGTSDLILHDVAGRAVHDSLGDPSPGVEVRVDPETGELQLRTPFGMLGYLDMPAETRAAYAEGWLRTGDVVARAPDGRLVLTGRMKEIINRAGNKVSPLEIEGLFAAHPAVSAAMATGVADPRLGEAVHLMVVPRPGARVTPEALRDWAAGRIERFKLPDRIHLGENLPLGRTGKADRAALRHRLEADDAP